MLLGFDDDISCFGRCEMRETRRKPAVNPPERAGPHQSPTLIGHDLTSYQFPFSGTRLALEFRRLGC